MPAPDRPTEPEPPGSSPRTRPSDALRALALGTRVVVRSRIEGGFTDAIGDLAGLTATEATIRTRRGDAVVRLEAIVAAKPVPPPARRRPRHEN